MRAPAIGDRWEVRGLLGAIVAVAVLLVGVMPIALADTSPESDVPCEIGAGQYKYDVEEDKWTPSDPGVDLEIVLDENGQADSITVPDGWVIVCAKAGTEKEDPGGRTADMDQAISHIVIAVETTTTSSVDGSTTSSVDSSTTSSMDSSTTSSVDSSTTSSVDSSTTSSMDSSTTSSVDSSTTSSVDSSTTSSVDGSTTSSMDESTTSSGDDPEDEVLPTVVTTAPGEVDDDELPFTGLDSEVMVGLAILFLGAGAALLAMTRRAEEN